MSEKLTRSIWEMDEWNGIFRLFRRTTFQRISKCLTFIQFLEKRTLFHSIPQSELPQNTNVAHML